MPHAPHPYIAIVDANTLAAIGLQQMLQNVMPAMAIETYGSFNSFLAAEPDRFFHYFVAMDIVLEQNTWFTEHRRKTIVLTTHHAALNNYHTLCTNQPESALVRQLLTLMQHGHAGGRNLPTIPSPSTNSHHPTAPNTQHLTDREMEVMTLIVQGHINKEIADRLNIALATVITHRRNIMDKLGLKSVSALTIYAVMHGYVDINKI